MEPLRDSSEVKIGTGFSGPEISEVVRLRLAIKKLNNPREDHILKRFD
jgi:hypothetical protein